jgi:hypothetical protein
VELHAEIIGPNNDGEHALPERKSQIPDRKKPTDTPEPTEKVLVYNYVMHSDRVPQYFLWPLTDLELKKICNKDTLPQQGVCTKTIESGITHPDTVGV